MLTQKEIDAIINKPLYKKPHEHWVAKINLFTDKKNHFCPLVTCQVFCFVFQECVDSDEYIIFSARRFSELIDANPRKVSHALEILVSNGWLHVCKSHIPHRYKTNKGCAPWDK